MNVGHEITQHVMMMMMMMMMLQQRCHARWWWGGRGGGGGGGAGGGDGTHVMTVFRSVHDRHGEEGIGDRSASHREL